jgi:glycosyltransferase involved in cell wall biosynthesis
MASADLIGKRATSPVAPPRERAGRLIQANATSGVNAPKAVVIIPAYNEERFIGSVVLQAYKHVDTVVVVDDGSTDSTAEIAEAAGAVVVRHAHNQGKGAALNTGFQMARELDPDVVVTLDADGQHLPDEISVVAAPVLEGQADIVVGSRYLEKKSRVPFHRVWAHRIFNFITKRVSRVSMSDSQSGFRAFSPRALGSISFHASDFSVESEMQFLAFEHNLRTRDVPITIFYHGKPKRVAAAHGLIVLNGILRLVGQYRPLLFFGVPGILLLMAGIAWGFWIIDIYHRFHTLAEGYVILSALLTIIGTLALFTGIILHSVRGLLLDLVRPRPDAMQTMASGEAPQQVGGVSD